MTPLAKPTGQPPLGRPAPLVLSSYLPDPRLSPAFSLPWKHPRPPCVLLSLGTGAPSAQVRSGVCQPARGMGGPGLCQQNIPQTPPGMVTSSEKDQPGSRAGRKIRRREEGMGKVEGHTRGHFPHGGERWARGVSMDPVLPVGCGLWLLPACHRFGLGTGEVFWFDLKGRRLIKQLHLTAFGSPARWQPAERRPLHATPLVNGV